MKKIHSTKVGYPIIYNYLPPVYASKYILICSDLQTQLFTIGCVILNVGNISLARLLETVVKTQPREVINNAHKIKKNIMNTFNYNEKRKFINKSILSSHYVET